MLDNWLCGDRYDYAVVVLGRFFDLDALTDCSHLNRSLRMGSIGYLCEIRPDLKDVWNTLLLPYLDEEPELVLRTRKQRVLFELMHKCVLHDLCRNRMCEKMLQRGDCVFDLNYWSFTWKHCSLECRLKTLQCIVVFEEIERTAVRGCG